MSLPKRKKIKTTAGSTYRIPHTFSRLILPVSIIFIFFSSIPDTAEVITSSGDLSLYVYMYLHTYTELLVMYIICRSVRRLQ
ncbi:hypothetical protein F4815DRAFT_475855 [Daldinia loculata]|nr:hypothetical protein F4815DRAFT_475855 [Daldinia loculata]